MEHLDARRWRKSSYSGNGGADCVEIGVDAGTRHVLVPRHQNCRGPVLEFTSAAWSSFAGQQMLVIIPVIPETVSSAHASPHHQIPGAADGALSGTSAN